ncbi:CRISPR system precrRNA processing endoribonuclease RAMP protein Cas6 [Stetteria hydrogenophila]
MARPFFHTLLEGVGGFVVSVSVRFTALRDVVLPPFTGRVLKTLLHASPCMEALRGLYASRPTQRPVRLTALRLGWRRLYQTVDSAGRGPLRVRAGSTLRGVVSAIVRGDPFAVVGDAGGCSGRLPAPLDGLSFEVEEVKLETVEGLTAGVRAGEEFKLVIHTPLLLDTKLMTPPVLVDSSLVKVGQAYRLLPTPSYIAAAAVRLWLALARGERDLKAESWIPYAVGRLSDVLVAEVDYKLKPVTAIYGRAGDGGLRKARGPVGYVILKPLSDRLAPILDKTLALAQRLGLGKSRAIGFGEVEVQKPR